MTTFERFERSIPDLMTELAPARVPDYLDDMLHQTAGATQRPAWSFPERWLPVEITARPLSMRSFPWRPLLVLALVAGLIAAGLAVYVGSQNRLPPPFGPAGNGLLLYRDADGAIVSLDPKSGSQATVVPASDAVGDPVLSRDGRRIALVPHGSATPRSIVVRGVDGSYQSTLAGDYREIDSAEWSPDGRHLAIVSNVGGLQSIIVADADGSGRETLPLGRQVSIIAYLPDGRLAMMAAERSGDVCPAEQPTDIGCALFVVNADGTRLERLIPADAFHGINTLSPSPDGRQLLWVEWNGAAAGRLHLFDLATHADHRFADEAFPTPYAMNRAWFSPDGKAILFDFFESNGDHWGIVPSVGGAPVRIGQRWPDSGSGQDAGWAPDGKSILARYTTSDTSSDLWLLDPTGSGRDTQLHIDIPYLPLWQRLSS